MFQRLKNVSSELRLYHSHNSLVNYLLLLAIVIIILVQASQDMPVLFGWNAATVNFYLEVLINLSIGYIVSTIFYVLVVYYPHRKRVKVVKVRTRIIFSRLYYRLKSIADLLVSSVNLSVDASKRVPPSYTDTIRELDLLTILKNKEVVDPWGCSNALERVIRDSSEIISYKLMLVQFLAFMDAAELKLYADLEEIFIFENMDKLDKWPYNKEELLGHEFQYIVEAYNDCQDILSFTKDPIVWKSEPDFDPSCQIHLNQFGEFI